MVLLNNWSHYTLAPEVRITTPFRWADPINLSDPITPESTLMIPRYSRKEMSDIWSAESKFRIWFEIEAHAADALAQMGVIPTSAAEVIWEKGGKATFDIDRIDEIEREVKHDVIAFLTHLSEIVGDEARFIHQGMTSSDVLDTCFNVQLVRAADIMITDLDKLMEALKERAYEYKKTPFASDALTPSTPNP